MAQQASMTQQASMAQQVSWSQMKPIYFPLMRSVPNSLELVLEKSGESTGSELSNIDDVIISGVYKRAANCTEEKFCMRFANKYCNFQGHEFLQEGILIF